jgi:hypothetical protein
LIKDLTNQKFEYLTVIKYLKSNKGNGAIWLCECICGKLCEVRSYSLLRHKTKSCGCKKKELISLKLTKKNNSSNITQLYNTYKNQAKIRNYSWNLSKEQFVLLTEKNCFYCGKEPSSELKKSHFNGDHILLYNGIDRKNNNIGYEIDNVVTACGICNKAKNNLSIEEFISWIRRLTKNFSERESNLFTESKNEI